MSWATRFTFVTPDNTNGIFSVLSMAADELEHPAKATAARAATDAMATPRTRGARRVRGRVSVMPFLSLERRWISVNLKKSVSSSVDSDHQHAACFSMFS
ncbi:hypothetical protein GCM10009617_09380 [Leifsonia poae]|uniref:Uncharacterized protein n=1 Tax=Leifsonia poae TaxID=110933 RepID=A0A9W6LYR4_9MICO|nr:hypothetical protein GCM10017584_10370 [Leifsonia poae]